MREGVVQLVVLEDSGVDWEDNEYRHCHVLVTAETAYLVAPIANPLELAPHGEFKTFLVDDVDFEDLVALIRRNVQTTPVKCMDVFNDGSIDVTFDEIWFLFLKALLEVPPLVVLF